MAGITLEEAKWVLLFGILIVILIWAMALTYLVLRKIRQDEKKKEPKVEEPKTPDEKHNEVPESTEEESKPEE